MSELRSEQLAVPFASGCARSPRRSSRASHPFALRPPPLPLHSVRLPIPFTLRRASGGMGVIVVRIGFVSVSAEPSLAPDADGSPGPGDGDKPGGQPARPLVVTGGIAACAAAASGLAVLVTLTAVGWITAPHVGIGAGLGGVLRTAATLWLVAHHVGFTVRGAGRIGLLPLGLVLLPGALLAMAGRWVVRAGAVTRLRHVGYAAIALALPYALLAGALAVASGTSVAAPSLLQAVIAAFLLALVAGGLGAARGLAPWSRLGSLMRPRRRRGRAAAARPARLHPERDHLGRRLYPRPRLRVRHRHGGRPDRVGPRRGTGLPDARGPASGDRAGRGPARRPRLGADRGAGPAVPGRRLRGRGHGPDRADAGDRGGPAVGLRRRSGGRPAGGPGGGVRRRPARQRPSGLGRPVRFPGRPGGDSRARHHRRAIRGRGELAHIASRPVQAPRGRPGRPAATPGLAATPGPARRGRRRPRAPDLRQPLGR